MASENQALKRAIDIVGDGAELGRRIGVTPQAVSQWLKNGVPAERVLSIERATEGRVPRSALRPDLYPDEGVAA